MKHPNYLGGWLLDTIHSIILHLGQIAGDFWPCLRAKTLFLTWKPTHKIYLWIYWTGNSLNLLPTLECEDIGAKMAKFSHPEMVLAKLKAKNSRKQHFYTLFLTWVWSKSSLDDQIWPVWHPHIHIRVWLMYLGGFKFNQIGSMYYLWVSKSENMFPCLKKAKKTLHLGQDGGWGGGWSSSKVI